MLNTLFLKRIDRLIGSSLIRLWPRPVRPAAPPLSISRLLLIRPGGIGDAVLLVPVILQLREVFPALRIEVLAERRNAGAFALCPEIDLVLCYDKPAELVAVLGRRYDVVIDTEQWHRLSAIVARTIRSQVKIGFRTNERKRLFTHPVGYFHKVYEVKSFLDLLKPLGLGPPSNISYPFLSIPEVDQASADKKLNNLLSKTFIVLFPGASIPERCWGTQKFHQLAVRLFDQGFSVIVVGGREDSAEGDAILDGTLGLNLAGKTSLSETAAVLNRSQLLIGGDSGVLHLGVGLDVPTVSLFGPGIAAKWAPRGEQHTVINHRLTCSPCTKFGTTPPCPIDAKCIQDISVDEVFVAAQNLLGL